MITETERLTVARVLAQAMQAAAEVIFHQANQPHAERDRDLITRVWQAQVVAACNELAPYLRGRLQ